MADTERQIGFEQIGIGSVLSRYWLKVPLNQREYSWKEREVKSLFQDVARAMSNNEPEYFLGTIVTIPTSDNSLEVVDGQQRLATTVILYAAIRNHLKGRAIENVIVEDIQGRLTAVERKERRRKPRLRLNVTDSEYFTRRVLESDEDVPRTSVSHGLIEEAAEIAAKFVSEVVAPHEDSAHGDVLNTWLDYLEHNAVVVLLKVPSPERAYKMFETLNDRGLKTSQSDLVKNYLFGEARDRLPEAQNRWAAMRGVLESFEDEDMTVVFLRQALISMKGYLRESEVYDKVQAAARGASQSLELLSQFERASLDYAAIQSSDHEKWNAYPLGTRRAIATLRLLRVTPMRPLMLSIARAFPPAETEKAFRLLLCLAVRFLVAGGARTIYAPRGDSISAKEQAMSRALSLVLVVMLVGCVTTNVIPLAGNNVHPALQPSDVDVFVAENDIPFPYEKVAFISAEGSSTWTNEKEMVEAAKKEAAKLGANGIVIGQILEPSAGAKVAGAIFGVSAERKGRLLAVYVKYPPGKAPLHCKTQTIATPQTNGSWAVAVPQEGTCELYVCTFSKEEAVNIPDADAAIAACKKRQSEAKKPSGG